MTTKPTIHLNGTSPDVLRDGYIDAAEYMRRAIEALKRKAAPHGRDYYTQSVTAFGNAAEEHHQRLLRLESVLEELEELAEHCADEAAGRGLG